MVYVPKPDLEKEPGPDGQAFEYKSRLVICGNRQPWEQSEETALTANMPPESIVLLRPPAGAF
eukprot:131264-Amphidinium_carterae.1